MMTAGEPSLVLPTDATPVRAAAALYARAGFAPVPVHGVRGSSCACGRVDCEAIGKHPVGNGWQKRAAADVDVARELFAEHDGNIGIVVGDGYVVIDIDDYHGGRDSLAELPPMPPTLTSRSGSGQGEHRIYTLAPGQDAAEITNRAIAKGVDVKVRGGQVVVAPSLHRSGHRYQWIDLTPPAPLPDALYERIRKRRVVPLRSVPTTGGDLHKRASRYMEKLPAAIAKQEGHKAAFAAARALWGWIRKGLSEGEGWDLFVTYNQRCEPPWNESELRHKWTDAQRAEHVPELADRHPQGQAPATSPSPSAPGEVDWRSLLLFKRVKSGPDKPDEHHENAVVVLRYHPQWRGRLAFDEHAQRTLVTAPPWHDSDRAGAAPDEPVEWTDADTARLSSWIRREVAPLKLSTADCDRAVQIVSESNRVHPFRSWLDGLAWDGIYRLDKWLSIFLGVVASPYSAAVGAWWLVSAVARTYQPGCKADHVLILEGPQGLKKSTALRTLAGDRWFSDTPIDIGSKDAYLALQGRVIVELGELDSLRRADADRAKVFFSSPIDQFRPPYGRRSITAPRGCVFAGTVNHSSYLTDDTGGRRYWPVRCQAIDAVSLLAAREQLWAEAVARYRAGGRWWPEGPAEADMCAGEVAPRSSPDPWEDAVTNYARGQDELAVPDVLRDACKLGVDEFNRAAEMRVARLLAGLGYERKRVAYQGGRRWVYVLGGSGQP